MGVLKTRLSPNSSANVAASLKTPPNRLPTSCPYKSDSGCLRIISSRAESAQSTITTFSAPAGLLSPTSSVISVGAKSCVNKSSGFGSSRSEEHTSELQSRPHLVGRLLLEKKKKK